MKKIAAKAVVSPSHELGQDLLVGADVLHSGQSLTNFSSQNFGKNQNNVLLALHRIRRCREKGANLKIHFSETFNQKKQQVGAVNFLGQLRDDFCLRRFRVCRRVKKKTRRSVKLMDLD